MKTKLSLLLVFTLIFSIVSAQDEADKYVPETDSLVLQKLEAWQDIKFGLLMHWGTYSQWGIVESWSICPEDYGWCARKKGNHPDDYFAYKKEYENLQTTFNPVNFNPDKWAEAAQYAGMRYVIFTTKHHDGFCMFDTKYTDYKITSEKCPFHTNPRANIAKEVFDAFRAKGFWTGAYFSKPDWHSPYYWDPYFPPTDRNVNYNPELYPEKWEKFVEYTHNQMLELMSDYGKMDIIWLDGGWVAKYPKEVIDNWYRNRVEKSKNGFLKQKIVSQDIRMDEIVKKMREKQPGLIVVDRAVHGINQNYLTPENRVPDRTLPYPWESCIISGGGWSYTSGAKYMSGREGIHLLVDVVAKGGNLLLNIAPGPDGTWQQGAYDLLKEFGDWMKINSEAIYSTRPIEPYKENNICMTRKKDGTVYFIYLAKENEQQLPKEIHISSHKPVKGAEINILGAKTPLKWKNEAEGFKVLIPAKLRNNPPCKYAWVIKVSTVQ